MDVDSATANSKESLGGVRTTDLLHQQMWCWGQDVGGPGGNLLIRYGFERIPKPEGSNAPSIYRLDVSATARVVLRGFGVFYGDDRWGGLFLRRYGFSPQLTPEPDLPRPAWRAQDLPPLVEPRDADVARSDRLLLEVVQWIRTYEVWVVDNVGLDYRRRSLVTWKPRKYTVTPAADMADAWQTIGLALAGLCARDNETREAG